MDMRGLGVIALSAVFGMASAQDMTKPITFKTRAARCSEVIKQIGTAAQLNLQVSPQMKGEIILISVEGQPIGELLARIATVTSGEWKHEGDVMRLVPNSQLRQLEDRSLVKHRADDFQKAVNVRLKAEKTESDRMEALLKKQAETAKSSDSKTAPTKGKSDNKTPPIDFDPSDDAPTMGNPDESLITHLLAGISPTVIGQMVPGDRLVFSTDPNRLQRSFGSEAPALINAFIQKHNDIVSKSPTPDMGDFAGADEAQIEAIRRNIQMRTAKIGSVAKVNLVVKSTTRMGFGMGDVELCFYDAKGAVIYFTISNLGMGTPDGLPQDSPIQITAPSSQPAPPSKQTQIEYSEDSKAIITALKSTSNGNLNASIPKEVEDHIMQTDKYDPLSFAATDELLTVAKRRQLPLVADISDDWDQLLSINSSLESDTSVEDVERRIKQGRLMSEVPDTAWFLLRPSYPSESRSIRADREALAALLKSVKAKTVPSLDDLSAFAASSPDPTIGGFCSGYLLLFVPGGLMQGFGNMTSWNMLRFYSQLSPEARTNLTQGGRISLGSLTAYQHAALESMVYGAETRLVSGNSSKKEDPLSIFNFGDMMNAGASAKDYQTEPTELAPNGLPSDGYFEVQAVHQNFAAPAVASNSPLMAMMGIMGPDEMAFFKLMKEQKGAEEFTSMLPDFGKLRVGDQSIYNFTFHLTPQVYTKKSLRDHYLPANSSTVSAANLPAEFQKQISDRMQVLKKAGLGNLGGMLGNSIHP